ncbi:hypothetical protein CYLTODRAFT_423258 [Cylindrobasidium torrendii FP15055 ss-10]|uniref:C2H2-type domain-containing protein n=1 Tax=Cylindrobasidium torrendii FP15055 ss-10 TaxID=1314674 RepID=A0A0D7B7R5_9AGAR|nr:hypothetical protein CYLTODRAFT_423258 [Cylindrobasidium torrendii FP15055 ss-10]
MGLHSCEDCGWCASTPTDLRRHESAIHIRARPFACTYPDCSFASGWQSVLQRHLRAHEGIKTNLKTYPCTWQECGLVAQSPQALRKHEVRHTGPRPYPCAQQGCGKVAFATLEELLSHRRALHWNSGVLARKPVPSTQDTPSATGNTISRDVIPETLSCTHASCDYTTRKKRKLELHEARHTPETPFVCSHHKCRFACSKIKHLKRHVKSAHTENGPTQDEAESAPGKTPSTRKHDPEDDVIPTELSAEDLDAQVDATPEYERSGLEDKRKRVSARTRAQNHRPSSSAYEPSSDADDDADSVDEDISGVEDDASYVDEDASEVEDSEPPKRRRLRQSAGNSISTRLPETEIPRLTTPSSSQTFRRVEVCIPPAPEYIRRFRSQSVAPRPTTTPLSSAPRPSQASASSRSAPTRRRQPAELPKRQPHSVAPQPLDEDDRPTSSKPKSKKRKRSEGEEADRPPTKAEVKVMIQEGVRPLAEEINSLAEMIQLLVRRPC